MNHTSQIPDSSAEHGLGVQSLVEIALNRVNQRTAVDEKPIVCRGVFQRPSGDLKRYGAYVYVPFHDSRTMVQIKVKMHESFLGEIEWGREFTIVAVLSCANNIGKLEPLLTLDSIKSAGEGKASRSNELLERWSQVLVRPKRDPMQALSFESPQVTLITSISSVALDDIRSQLGESERAVVLNVKRIAINVPSEVARTVRDSYDSHLIVISRGGGADVATLDSDELIEAIASAPIPTAIAAGHATDRLLLDRVADVAFPTPTAFGRWLRNAIELRRSREFTGKNLENGEAYRQAGEWLRKIQNKKVMRSDLETGPNASSPSTAPPDVDGPISTPESERPSSVLLEYERTINGYSDAVRAMKIDAARQEQLINRIAQEKAQFKVQLGSLVERNEHLEGRMATLDVDRETYRAAARQAERERDWLRTRVVSLTEERSKVDSLLKTYSTEYDRVKKAYLAKKAGLAEREEFERHANASIQRLKMACSGLLAFSVLSTVLLFLLLFRSSQPSLPSQPITNNQLNPNESVPAALNVQPPQLDKGTDNHPGPFCPVCGTQMVRRDGRHGKFWGCPDFPNCRGTRSIK